MQLGMLLPENVISWVLMNSWEYFNANMPKLFSFLAQQPFGSPGSKVKLKNQRNLGSQAMKPRLSRHFELRTEVL
jgi:hypothetical protein